MMFVFLGNIVAQCICSRYTDSNTRPGTLPDSIHSPDPGPGEPLMDLTVTSALVPIIPEAAPKFDHQVNLTFIFNTLPDGINKAFINNIVRTSFFFFLC